MDRIAEYARKLRAVAQHEVGHYVANRHFGFETGGITVQVDPEGPGRNGRAQVALHTHVGSMAALETYLFRRCVVLQAGALSELLPAGTSTREIHEDDADQARRNLADPNSGAFVDNAIATELRFLLRNIRFPETPMSDRRVISGQVQRLQIDDWEKTMSVVGQHAETICAVGAIIAARLESEGETISISAAELEAIPQIAAIIPIG